MSRAAKVLQHTLGHVDCPACEELRRTILEIADGKNISFIAAAEIWQQVHNQEVSPGTAKHYEDCLRPLRAFFGKMRLSDIHIGHIVEYRQQRQIGHLVNGRHFSAGPSRINQEIATLSQIMERAGLWESVARHYRPMRKPRVGPGQRIPVEELHYLFEVAEKKPRWKLAYLASLVCINTTALPKEVLSLRLRDLNFGEQLVSFVEGTKRDGARVRTVPMTDDCRWALAELLRIAEKKGCCRPEDYLFPHRAHEKGALPDPTRHQTHFRTAWEHLRKEAAKRHPSLARVRRADLRPTSISMMCDDPNVDLATIRKIAGHGPGSRLTIETYHHANVARKRTAVSSLNGLRGAGTPVPPPPRKTPQSAPTPPSSCDSLLKTDSGSRFIN
jgi:integrase